jgi:hypothetical protein
MKTINTLVKDIDGNPINNSKALLWGNNAAWLCVECGEMLGNRTGDTEYQVQCTNVKCTAKYEIDRRSNKSGKLHLGPAEGIRGSSQE